MKEIKNIFTGFVVIPGLVFFYGSAHPVETPVLVDSVRAQSIVEASPAPKEVQYEPVEEYIRLTFGVYADKAITMLKTCENKSLNPKAENWNGNGTWDFGLFQINQVHGYTREQLADYKFNTDVAWKIFKRAGYQFTDWTCAYSIGETPFYLK